MTRRKRAPSPREILAALERNGTPQPEDVHRAVQEVEQRRQARPRVEQLVQARLRGDLPPGADGCNEDVEHRCVVRRVMQLREEDPGYYAPLAFFIHVPNEEGWRGTQRGAGVVKGVPDFLLFSRRGPYVGFALELKARTRSRVGVATAEQETWLYHLYAEGWQTATRWCWEDAVASLLDYLEWPAYAR